MKRSNSNTSTIKREPCPAAERILVYFDERSKEFRGALRTAQSGFTVDGIHDMRVAVKRLRVLYELIDYIAPSFASKPSLLSFKELYQAAGVLRDIDICQEIATSYLEAYHLTEYLEQLEKEESQLRNTFAEVASRYSIASLSKSHQQIYSALAITREKWLQRRIEKKILKHAEKVRDGTSLKKQSNDDLHTVRKLSKALRYTLDIWQVCYGKTGPVTKISDQLKKAYGRLGEWHDALLVHDSVENFLTGKNPDSLADSEACTKFLEEMNRRARRLLGAYRQGKKPLLKSLDRLASDLHKHMSG